MVTNDSFYIKDIDDHHCFKIPVLHPKKCTYNQKYCIKRSSNMSYLFFQLV